MTHKIPTEHQEQVAVIDWFNSYGPTKGISPRLLIAIPNGSILAGDARMRAIQSHRLKREGMRVGMPDLFLAVPGTWYHGLFIELKRTGWTAPKSGKAKTHIDHQYTMLQLLELKQYRAVLCVGADAAISTIRGYLR